MPKTTDSVMSQRDKERQLDALQRGVHFTVVTDRHNFPFDMLRYDRCWPFTQDDVRKMTQAGGRFVRMRSLLPPTRARWESFGWRVVDVCR